MPLIQWDSSFSVGNQEIDRHHKKWVDAINSLHQTLMNGSSKELMEVTERVLKTIRDYTRNLFPYEEEYMQKISYPDLQAHKKIHNKFYVKILNYYNEFQEGRMVINTEIMSTLMLWLQDHILHEDKKYGEYAARQK